MSYNTELQTNNANLQTVLSTIQNLSSGSATSTTETWTLTMEDGSTNTKQMNIATVCKITYVLDYGITSSNTSTFVRQGDTYETVLSSGDSSSHTYFDTIVVDYCFDAVSGMELEFTPDESSPWLVYINTGIINCKQLIITATLTGIGSEDWED